MLDEFGDAAFLDLKETYQTSTCLSQNASKFGSQEKLAGTQGTYQKCWNFKWREIEAVNLQAGEDVALQPRTDKLLNHKKILRIR